MNHGTEGGYQTHRRNGEPTCDACRNAHSRNNQLRDLGLSIPRGPGFRSDQYNPLSYYRDRSQATDWMLQGKCRGKPQEWFFPEKGADPSIIHTAKRICSECPVQTECLDYALAGEEGFGIWGGMSVKERRREKRRRERLAS